MLLVIYLYHVHESDDWWAFLLTLYDHASQFEPITEFSVSSLAFTCFLLVQILPPGLWHCPNCTCKFCGAASRNHAEDSRNHAEDSERTVNEFLSCSLCDKKCKVYFSASFCHIYCLYLSWILRFPFADHRSCSLEMNALPAISNNPSATFCGQKCQEVLSYSVCEFFYRVKIMKQRYQIVQTLRISVQSALFFKYVSTFYPRGVCISSYALFFFRTNPSTTP